MAPMLRTVHGTPTRRTTGCRVVTTSLTARLLLANQLRALADEIDWTVVSGDVYDDPPDGITVEVVPVRREFAPSDIVAFVRLWRYLRRHRFGLVQTHTPKASFLGLPAARLAGSPAVYTIHGSLYFAGNGRRANLLGWLFERWCCSWATRVLVQSREDERVLPEVGICPHRKLAYVGNGIVMDRFVSPTPPAFRSERPVVMMVSRLVLEKGCADFIEVAASLAGEADFVHVGPSEHDQSDALPEAEIRSASDRGIVTFLGPGRRRPSLPGLGRRGRPSLLSRGHTRGWPWRRRPWDGRSWPTTSAACGRSSIPGSGSSPPGATGWGSPRWSKGC